MAAKKIRVEYFALLKDERGAAADTLETDAGTPGELYSELQTRHGLSLEPSLLKVAINEDFTAWDHPLAEGDTVVFIPPVAGG